MNRDAPRWLPWLGWGTALGALAVAVADVWPFVGDDAFISLRYADRLLDGAGLTWNDGERVEGYSNLLWILATAALRAAGLEWIALLRVLGIGCTAAALGALAFLPWGRRGAAGAGAALVLGALAPVGLWTIAGLETSMALLWSTLSAVLLARAFARAGSAPAPGAFAAAGGALALLCLTRPDGPLAVGMAGLAVLVCGRGGPRVGRLPPPVLHLGALLLPPLIAVAGQTAFRVVYYGDWVPNTARVKVAPSAESLAVGVAYLELGGHALRALLLPAALGLVAGLWRREHRGVALYCGGLALGWAAYLAVVGGDFFPLQRLLVPALGPIAVLAVLGFALLARVPGRAGPVLAVAAALGCGVLARVDADVDQLGRDTVARAWEWQGLAAGEWLGEAFAAERPLLAVDAAGAVPFASGLPCLDMLGLCDARIARQPPYTRAGFRPGHMQGDGGYVLERGTDLVMFAQPPGAPHPMFPSGLQMEEDPRFLQGYRCVLFDTGSRVLGEGSSQNVRLTLWAHLEGRLGARRAAGRVEVPGWWLGSYRQPFPYRVRLDPPQPGSREFAGAAEGLQWWQQAAVVGVRDGSGAVAGDLRGPGPFVLRELGLEPGDWMVAGEPADPGLTWSLRGSDGAVLERVGDAFRVEGAGGQRALVDVVCERSGAEGVRRVLHVVLQR